MVERVSITSIFSGSKSKKSEDLENIQNILENIKTDRIYKAIAKSILKTTEKYLNRNKENREETGSKASIDEDTRMVLTGDTFFLHYSMFPRVRKEKISNSFLEALREAFEKYVETDAYKRIRRITKLDRELSLAYTMRFIYEFQKELEEELSEVMDNNGAGDRSGDGSNTSEDTDSDSSGDKKDNIDADALRNAVGKAFENAVEKSEKVLKLVAGLRAGNNVEELAFLDATASVDEVEFETFIEVLDYLRKRMPIFTMKTKKRSRKGLLAGYTVTDDVENAIAEELVVDDLLFLAKLADGGFLAVERREKEKGLLIILLDISGSMEGEKIGWAKAVAVASAYKALRDKNDVYIEFFNETVVEKMKIDDLTSQAKKILSVQARGGTNIADALIHAFRLIRKFKARRATIQVITDAIDDSVRKDDFRKRLAGILEEYKAIINIVYIEENKNKALEEIARRTRGKIMYVKPDKENALRVVLQD